MSKAEIKLKEKIEELLSQKAESETDELTDSEHGNTDALLWLQEGSIQLTVDSLRKEIDARKYADKNQSKEYCEGYESALTVILKMLADIKK